MSTASLDTLLKLVTTPQKHGKTAFSYPSRRANIRWVSSLDREGLEFGRRERQILFKTTSHGERIYIQYPGKETEGARPWDFRPKVLLVGGGSYGVDADFGQIWDSLWNALKRDHVAPRHKQALAVIFYRMASMQDHVRQTGFRTTVRDFQVDGESQKLLSESEVDFNPSPFLYLPDNAMIDMLSRSFPRIGDLSLEAFLHYNDLLAWNEDCKYFHRAQEKAREKGKEKEQWMGSTGRPNTLLTHTGVIGFVMGHVPFSQLLLRASRMRGVAPISEPEALATCGEFLVQGSTSTAHPRAHSLFL